MKKTTPGYSVSPVTMIEEMGREGAEELKPLFYLINAEIEKWQE